MTDKTAVPQARIGARWVTAWLYGMDRFPTDTNLIDLIKAVFICAAGDGEVSKIEREFFLNYLDAVGVPDSLHDFIKTYPAKDSLDDVMKNPIINEQTKRIVVYHAMLVSGADGYAEGEHQQVIKMGAKLGLDEGVVNQIRERYEKDIQANKDRVDLLFPGAHPWAEKK